MFLEEEGKPFEVTSLSTARKKQDRDWRQFTGRSKLLQNAIELIGAYKTELEMTLSKANERVAEAEINVRSRLSNPAIDLTPESFCLSAHPNKELAFNSQVIAKCGVIKEAKAERLALEGQLKPLGSLIRKYSEQLKANELEKELFLKRMAG